MMLPSSSPSSRRALRKWPKSAALLCSGSALDLEAVAEERVASGGVDHEARLPLAHGAVGVDRGHAGGLARAPRSTSRTRQFSRASATDARGAAEEDLVELGAAHLVGDRHRAVGGVAEQEARAVGVRGRDEGRARLHHPDLGHLARDAQLLEERQVRRQQRLADVEARMGIFFHQDHAVAALAEQGRDGRSSGTATHDDDVALGSHLLSPHLRAPEHCNVEFRVPEQPRSTRTAPRAPITLLPQYWSDEGTRRQYVDELFDDTAGDYDFVENLLGLGTGPGIGALPSSRAGLRGGMRVLDLATGTGLVAREALRIIGPDGRLVGLDPSAGMLDEASQLEVPLVRGSASACPSPTRASTS
jgi:hypothetical protein